MRNLLLLLFCLLNLSACNSRNRIVDMPFEKVAKITRELFVEAPKPKESNKEKSADLSQLKKSPNFHMYYADQVEESGSKLSFNLQPVTKFKEIYEFEIVKLDGLRTQISLTSEDSRIPLYHCCCFWVVGPRGRNRLQEKKFMDALERSLK